MTIRIWLGGSFDPVHNGHLAIIQHVYQTVQQLSPQSQILPALLPTARSPFKQDSLASEHRLAMLQLAIKSNQQSAITIDDNEIFQTPPVYTFNTIYQFRQQYPDDSLIFVMGEDSLLQLHRWFRGNEISNFCHLWILPRQTEKNPTWFEFCDKQFHHLLTFQAQDLLKKANQCIYIDDFHAPNISSSQIRQWIKLGNIEKLSQNLPACVLEYILQNALYQP